MNGPSRRAVSAKGRGDRVGAAGGRALSTALAARRPPPTARRETAHIAAGYRIRP
ncbi:hypothetical protein [Actinomadura sp. 3N407]|uniref:hypothetical protein n=1 Tax=Actinomadura sp. 3N407 TaxID=3457423 RepID=UPI003FCCBB8E